MFAAIARFDIRFRWLIVAVWSVGVAAGVILLPSLASATEASNAQFLSPASPSVRASDLASPFQGRSPSSEAILTGNQAIVVAYRAAGPLTPADNRAVSRVERAVGQVQGVARVLPEGTSADGKTAVALVTVTAPAAQTRAGGVVDQVRAGFSQAGPPPGLRFYLTGQLAKSVDGSATKASRVARLTVIFVVVLLFVVYRALLAPLATLIPAVASLLLAGPLTAEAAKAGLPVASITQELLTVLLLGVGTDYGLFLAFRLREELARGRQPRDALVTAMERVGEAITYSGLTVAAALLTLLAAPFGIYRGLGPALAIGVGVLLAASLTLTPALLAICGSAAFWPARPRPGPRKAGWWGRVAGRAVRRPAVTLGAGIVLLVALAAGLTGYRAAGLTGSAPAASDSAAGARVLAAHFPRASLGSAQLLLRFAGPVWDDPQVLAKAQARLARSPVFASITGPPGTGSGTLTAAQLASLHARLGSPATLPQEPAAVIPVPPQLYQAYRATAQFISPGGRTVQYYAVLRAGPSGSAAAEAAIPRARAALASTARATRAQTAGVAGQDASAYDINAESNLSIVLVVPIVLALILVLLGLLLRSLIAPWYLAATVGLSYLASLGFAMIVFVHVGGNGGLFFILPLLMFVFSMAVGEDYNILVMSRIREELRHQPSLSHAITRAIGVTGGTVTSAGLILAGTFTVLGLAGGSTEAAEIGFPIAFAVALDTFVVRTLLVPAIATLLGRWNWWPSRPSAQPAAKPADSLPAPTRHTPHSA